MKFSQNTYYRKGSKITHSTRPIINNRNTLSNQLLKVAIRALHIMQVDASGIWLKDKRGNLKPRVYHGIKTDFADFLFSKKNFKVLQCIAKQSRPLAIYRLSKYCRQEDFKKHLENEGLRSLLACPIFIYGRKRGIIAVGTRNRLHRFTQTDKILLSRLADEIAANIKNAELTNRTKQDYLNTIRTIAHVLEANDKYTYGHSNKVMRYAVNICKVLRLKKRQIYLIKNAALLHDIGKIGIAQSILEKEGILTLSEWEEIKKHPAIGAKIVKQAGFLDDLAPIIKHHHAKFAGGGYPDPDLKYEKIPLGAKIIAIADAYDAMTSIRAYRKKPMNLQMALEEIRRNTGTQFDPEISKAFIKHIKDSAYVRI
ncbi:MAG: HD domain-containing protein [Candidatus Omnitrophica bacterium]|nr:HD domain-containing protein [Candidatus Omnitrophota bacterium]